MTPNSSQNNRQNSINSNGSGRCSYGNGSYGTGSGGTGFGGTGSGGTGSGGDSGKKAGGRPDGYYYHPQGENYHSMERRAHFHDYASRCYYMITLKKNPRSPRFGELQGDPSIPDYLPGSPQIVPSPLGLEIWRVLTEFTNQNDGGAFVHEIVVMPDHVHFIIYISGETGRKLGQYIGQIKTRCSQAMWQLYPKLKLHASAGEGKCEPSRSSTRTDIEVEVDASAGTAKVVAVSASAGKAKEVAVSASAGKDMAIASRAGKADKMVEDGCFAKQYTDSILTREGQLAAMHNYIKDNPRRLAVKKRYPQFYQRLKELWINGSSFNCYGNPYLLKYPKRVAVHVRSAWSPENVEAYKQYICACVAGGSVVVSPFISPAEKEIRRIVLEMGGRIIQLINHNFSDRYAPPKSDFALCEEGRLLIMCEAGAPAYAAKWSRTDSLALNARAKQLVEAVAEGRLRMLSSM